MRKASDADAGKVKARSKEDFCWVSLLRLPEFVDEKEFSWARDEVARKKGLDVARAAYFRYTEGACVQCLHLGPYDDEPATVAALHRFAAENGLRADITEARPHHEIYLSDPRRCAPEKRRTVLRLPVAPANPA